MKPRSSRQGSSTLRRRLASLLHFGVASAVVLVAATTGQAAEALLLCPKNAASGERFTAELTIDVGTVPHGAYSVEVSYYPSQVTIASVTGGDTAPFGTDPVTNPASFATGSTIIAAFQNASLSQPVGVVSVAHVAFDVVAAGSTSATIGLTVRNVFDTSGAPIETIGKDCTVSVSGSGSSTSSSTSSSTTTSVTSSSSSSSTSPVTSSSSSTTTTTPATSSTTLPCTTAECLLELTPACADEQVPAAVVRRLTRGFKLLMQARTAASKGARRSYGRSARAFKQAAKRAGRYASSRKARLTPDCAQEIQQAVGMLLQDAAAECVQRGVCPPSSRSTLSTPGAAAGSDPAVDPD